MFAVSLKNLQIYFGEKKGIDFSNKKIELKWGEKIAILGKNGSGKTTLINAILKKIPYKGEVIRNFDEEEVGIVFQNNEYSDLMKVYELITLVLNINKKDSEYIEFCNTYNLNDLKEKFINELSVGEKQRLTVGLVLSQNKKLFIFDELTSGLDYEKREFMKKLIKNKTKKNTVIQITHYFSEIENWATKLVILEKGEPIFFGEPKELFDLHIHYSYFEFEMSDFSDIAEEFKQKKILILEENNILIAKNEIQHREIIEILNAFDTVYTTHNQNIYSSYLLLLEDYKNHDN